MDSMDEHRKTLGAQAAHALSVGSLVGLAALAPVAGGPALAFFVVSWAFMALANHLEVDPKSGNHPGASSPKKPLE
jgi:hypothetical protein